MHRRWLMGLHFPYQGVWSPVSKWECNRGTLNLTPCRLQIAEMEYDCFPDSCARINGGIFRRLFCRTLRVQGSWTAGARWWSWQGSFRASLTLKCVSRFRWAKQMDQIFEMNYCLLFPFLSWFSPNLCKKQLQLPKEISWKYQLRDLFVCVNW